LAVEVSVLEICVFPISNFHLLGALSCGHIYPCVFETPDMISMSPPINNLENAVALIQTFLDERKENPVLFFSAIKESAHMPITAEK
jgi:hypothetical protein